jgi:hypothetical protein
MMGKHTPGPWQLQEPHHAWISAADGTPIEWQPNARLIAAAPELLEALEKLMDLGTGYGEASDLIRIICKPAIAKARGE